MLTKQDSKVVNSQKIDDKLIYQYFAANPPYMSVSGLKRYWEKYG